MRLDFHFYTIYVLSRVVGFSPDNAYVIAYASQYTDDEASENPILFENGGELEPIITAHRIFDPGAVTERICKKVWIPFHFVPGNLGIGDEQMLTRANSSLTQAMINELLSYDLLPYSRHLLGIMLHAYADTWSHQNFMGMVNGMNEASQLRVNGEDIWLYNLAPALGHAQTGATPDEPRLEWEYLDYKGELHRVANYNRAIEAAQNCHKVLSQFIDKFEDDFRDSQFIPWEQIAGKIMELFRTPTDLAGSVTAWGEAITASEFGFQSQGKDINLIYDASEWFNVAIKSESILNQESGQFIECFFKNDNYESSDLKYFNEAAGFYWSTLFNNNAERFGLNSALI
ncbi:MAG: hypothetical protein M0P73_00240 [Syntrophobacterales bacterium]|nr:hypothetical protein [Syntrophobacterales bacterium]